MDFGHTLVFSKTCVLYTVFCSRTSLISTIALLIVALKSIAALYFVSLGFALYFAKCILQSQSFNSKLLISQLNNSKRCTYLHLNENSHTEKSFPKNTPRLYFYT